MRACLSAILLAVVGPAIAGEAVGTIEFLQVGYGGTSDDVYMLVQINGQRTNIPGCANQEPRLVVNPNTAAGKAILAALLAAKAAGSTVRIWGNGSCSVMATHESISYMRLM